MSQAGFYKAGLKAPSAFAQARLEPIDCVVLSEVCSELAIAKSERLFRGGLEMIAKPRLSALVQTAAVVAVIAAFGFTVLPASNGPSVTGGAVCESTHEPPNCSGVIVIDCVGAECPTGIQYTTCNYSGTLIGTCVNDFDACSDQNPDCEPKTGIPQCDCE
jgi:hypothetical protein